MSNMIKNIFIIIGVMTATLLMFLLIFSSYGQSFLWRAIRPAMELQWNRSTMNNGADRSQIFEEEFERYRS